MTIGRLPQLAHIGGGAGLAVGVGVAAHLAMGVALGVNEAEIAVVDVECWRRWNIDQCELLSEEDVAGFE